MKRHTRTMLTLIAVGIIIAAAIWRTQIAKNDPLEDIARQINEYGYALKGDDIYILGAEADSSIRQMLALNEADEDIALLVDASRAAGFAADVDKQGEINVLLAPQDNGVITIYLINGQIELCFIQTEEGEVMPL